MTGPGGLGMSLCLCAINLFLYGRVHYWSCCMAGLILLVDYVGHQVGLAKAFGCSKAIDAMQYG